MLCISTLVNGGLSADIRPMPVFRRKQRTDKFEVPTNVPSPFDTGGRLRLQCWYCEEEIEYQGFDPCAVVFIANWGCEGHEREQQFFAHAECFRKSGSGSELHILDPDFAEG